MNKKENQPPVMLCFGLFIISFISLSVIVIIIPCELHEYGGKQTKKKNNKRKEKLEKQIHNLSKDKLYNVLWILCLS